jgi:hypothetical protein
MVDKVARPTNQSTAQYITAPFELDNLEMFSQQRKANGLQALVKSNRRSISFERVATGRPLGKTPTFKTFAGREQLRWDAMQEQRTSSSRSYRTCSICHVKFWQGIALLIQLIVTKAHVGIKRSIQRGINSPCLSND